MKEELPEKVLSETAYMANAIGRGLIAGLMGTLAITLAQMAITGRKESKAPAEAVEKTLDIMPIDRADEERLSMITHWGYGTSWGLFRSALDEAGVTGWPATAVHFSAIFGVALFALPKMNIYEPVTEWPAKQIALDAFQHAVYATAAGVVYDLLKGADER